MKNIILGILTSGAVLLFTGCAIGSQPGGFSFKNAANGPMLTKMEKPFEYLVRYSVIFL